jgi:BirA family biotin operon repressor/biotin-[acetyl-CoA-carboxylase] ligase
VSPVFSLLSACGIREAVKEFTGIDLMIKWPNDLFLNGKKIGGILNELSAETDKVRFIVIGAGINVNNEPGTLPENAASLKDYAKKSINRAELVKEILRKIESNYALFNKEGPVPIIEKCRSCNLTLGERVRVQYRKNITCGFAIDLDIDGGLLIREDSGIISKVMSGDVVHLHQTE